MIEQTVEEKELSEDYKYREVQRYLTNMIEGGLEFVSYSLSVGIDKKPFWSVTFRGSLGGCVMIDRYTPNGFEMITNAHIAFVCGR